MLQCDQLGHAAAVGVGELAQLEQNLGAARERRGSPLRKRARGRGDGRIHFGGIGETDFGAHLTRSGIENFAAASGARGSLLAADPVLNGALVCLGLYLDIRRCHRHLRKLF